ncbi:TPA: hypothetical protein N0F65_010519 [Lagenidium giganteum]|uniref:EamA domain-containing protein n=1 Tax=Lagenidium giganteum TaxID=4803 RepID=A0AAV2Z9K3_9STRA|nr:TPA: hypothetical protein N0F65_010519 [Lagenidium giganteum]
MSSLIVSWILQGEASQGVQTRMGSDRPWFLVCFNHSSTMVVLPLVMGYHTWRDPTGHQPWNLVALIKRHSVLPVRILLSTAAKLCACYCVADYFWFAAIGHVSIAAGTAIFNCSPVFVYCLSVWILGERPSLKRLSGVLTSLLGIVLTIMFQAPISTQSTTAMAEDRVWSIIAGLFLVVAAALYAVLNVGFKAIIGDETTDTTTLLLIAGLVGLMTLPVWFVGSIIFAWCPVSVLHEPWEWPASVETTPLLVAMSVFAAIFYTTFSLSVAWTSPLETSVGCMMTIPLAGVFDAVVRHTRFSVPCLVGGFLIMAGFGILELTAPTPPAQAVKALSPQHPLAIDPSVSAMAGVAECTALVDPIARTSTDESTKATRASGKAVLASLVIVWFVQAEVSQALQDKLQFNKPWFIVCFNHTSTGMLLPLMYAWCKLKGTSAERTHWLDVVATLERCCTIPLASVVRMAIKLSLFYCIADYFWYTPLANLSVTAGSAIFSSSPLFVYFFSICFLHDRPSTQKLCGVVVSLVGVLLVIFFQNPESMNWSVASLESSSVLAGLLMVVAAAVFGGYEVTFRIVTGKSMTDMSTLLVLTGFIGLFTPPFWLAGSVLLAVSPISMVHEAWGWPINADAVALMLLSGVLAIASNVFLPLSIAWTSPLETSAGCMMIIPLSGIFDTLVHDTRFSAECIVGSMLVMVGFAILELRAQCKKGACCAARCA